MSEGAGHTPVLKDEVMAFLSLRANDRVCDLTLGAGGHSLAMIEATGPGGLLMAFDQDPVALRQARERLGEFADRLIIVEANFAEAERWLDEYDWKTLDGALLDIGVSSMQIDDPGRGFSFSKNGPLDMRMSPAIKVGAAELLATADAEELERIFREYGEEPRARAIAAKVVSLRRRIRLTTTRELAELVRSVTGGGGRIHPATRVFQALRIAVNDELGVLSRVLPVLMERLNPGRRLVVISFHSLEDRIVKRAMKEAEKSGLGRVLTKKPVQAGREEVGRNPRARSARLRAFEKGEAEA